jgi:hypothetical protein
MSARQEVTVRCDQCWSTWSLINSRSIRLARSQAAYMGWVYDGTNDFCKQEHKDEFYRRQNIHLVEASGQ